MQVETCVYDEGEGVLYLHLIRMWKYERIIGSGEDWRLTRFEFNVNELQSCCSKSIRPGSFL